MVGRPAGRVGFDTLETEVTEITLIDKGFDDSDGVVLIDVVIK
jgi:hypothetical protein